MYRTLRQQHTSTIKAPLIKVNGRGQIYLSKPSKFKKTTMKENRDIKRAEVLAEEIDKRYKLISQNS